MLTREHKLAKGLSDLDNELGVLVTPARIDPYEAEVSPKSLQSLDAASASVLKLLMDATAQGLLLGQYVFCELPILWVAAEDGSIFFAVEEVRETATQDFVFPRLRGTKISEPNFRLGHPSLLGGASGRIGGEIYYDVRSKKPFWYITNESGRYGLLRGRTKEQLENAAKRFAQFDIDLEPRFIKRRQRNPNG